MPFHLLAMGAGAALGQAGRWIAGKAPGAINGIVGVNNALPVIEEEGDVTVIGTPQSEKRRLYFLAMALVWGVVKRRNIVRALPPAGAIVLEYSLEHNAVRVIVRLRTSYLENLVAGQVREARGFAIFEGPENGPYLGGIWQWNSVLPGTPGGLFKSTLETGWESRPILVPTAIYSDPKLGSHLIARNPPPLGDGVSRVLPTLDSDPRLPKPTAAEYLLVSALTEPCSSHGMTLNRPHQPPAIPTPPAYPGGPLPPVPVQPPATIPLAGSVNDPDQDYPRVQ